MVKIKKLLSNTLPDFIDLFYGITAVWIDYYKLFTGVVGTFYLSEFYSSNILKIIWGEVPQGFIKAEIQKGTFSKVVMSIFLMFVIFRIITLILATDSKRAKIYSVCEIVVGFISANISIHLDPIVTFDKIFIFICWFILIKWGLMTITKIFKISTRHFGSYKKEVICLEFPISGNKRDEEAGSSE